MMANNNFSRRRIRARSGMWDPTTIRSASVLLLLSSCANFSNAFPIVRSRMSDVQNSALEIVQGMASIVAAQPKTSSNPDNHLNNAEIITKVEGMGKNVFATDGKNGETSSTKSSISKSVSATAEVNKGSKSDSEDLKKRIRAAAQEEPNAKEQVWTALSRLESNMELLDELAGQKQQLSALEFTLLTSFVVVSGAAPFFGGIFTEVVSPAAAACCAAIGIGAEYVGKTAVADGKEVAAVSIQCSAEAEAILAQAERAKAITPLCVGVGATSATLSLLIPTLVEASGLIVSKPGVREVFLLCPIASILSAAIAGLAVEETRQLSKTAIGVGNRRFARSGNVGRTWLSTAEQIRQKSTAGRNKLSTFTRSVLPAPLLGVLVPGALATKAVVITAIAAAESAYFLAQAEYTLSRATDAVALKTRSAAVCDTYANQGSRSAAILPFTSALSALCAATTAALVELPFYHTATSATLLAGQVSTITIFPAMAALFAGAASVSKARCEVDAEAAMQAASTLALEYEDGEENPILQPFKATQELIRLTIVNSVKRPLQRMFSRFGFILRLPRRWLFRATLRRAFKIFDSDRNGLLSGRELRRCVNKLGVKLTDDEATRLMTSYDKDKDGSINYKEFVDMMMS